MSFKVNNSEKEKFKNLIKITPFLQNEYVFIYIQEVVLTVCGTKMFPVPSVADILMDLYCDDVPFHQGRAHQVRLFD